MDGKEEGKGERSEEGISVANLPLTLSPISALVSTHDLFLHALLLVSQAFSSLFSDGPSLIGLLFSRPERKEEERDPQSESA